MGVSFDSPDRNHAWAVDEGFGFELWTDTRHDLSEYYGAAEPGAFAPDRITVLLDPQGTLVLEYIEGVDVGTHPQDVLDDCTVLFGG